MALLMQVEVLVEEGEVLLVMLVPSLTSDAQLDSRRCGMMILTMLVPFQTRSTEKLKDDSKTADCCEGSCYSFGSNDDSVAAHGSTGYYYYHSALTCLSLSPPDDSRMMIG